MITTFSEFHVSVTKSMPDVGQYPEMYNLCYELMKLSWNAAILSAKEAKQYETLHSSS